MVFIQIYSLYICRINWYFIGTKLKTMLPNPVVVRKCEWSIATVFKSLTLWKAHSRIPSYPDIPSTRTGLLGWGTSRRSSALPPAAVECSLTRSSFPLCIWAHISACYRSDGGQSDAKKMSEQRNLCVTWFDLISRGNPLGAKEKLIKVSAEPQSSMLQTTEKKDINLMNSELNSNCHIKTITCRLHTTTWRI